MIIIEEGGEDETYYKHDIKEKCITSKMTIHVGSSSQPHNTCNLFVASARSYKKDKGYPGSI